MFKTTLLSLAGLAGIISYHPNFEIKVIESNIDRQTGLYPLDTNIVEVEKIVVLETSNEELTCLAQNIVGEAIGESKKGKYAVAESVVNRVASSYFPNTICEVVKANNGKTWAYSAFNPKDPNFNKMAVIFSNLTEDKILLEKREEAYIIAANVMSENYKRLLPKNTWHYHANSVRPFWIKGNESQKVATIKNHTYYAGRMLKKSEKKRA